MSEFIEYLLIATSIVVFAATLATRAVKRGAMEQMLPEPIGEDPFAHHPMSCKCYHHR